MLQSMGSQRVEYDLVSEQKNSPRAEPISQKPTLSMFRDGHLSKLD